ncbi:Fbox domain/WD domain, G-beta repeat-containing protein [Acanthamoeba castellanii str. Neff]|uniref:Fbox domain/WD domain, G-beta repeat-containing protein n=1 Tax=Acanthamoeba castellanii (strain ATCC 30010 / Neff) TaxID=1257118 RepID=L8HJ29_ACACF|nr:Fbox domain/WD domain, G-beta repeat-containing protein [Acanthamoeba castellanii str. Neff]ELR24698.1 Fbox domain/WD domain, G-beta repeat-containing protein [Acanthamoeba castellanii str. Neff]
MSGLTGVAQVLHHKVSLIKSLMEDLSEFASENCVHAYFADSLSMFQMLEEELSIQFDRANFFLSFLADHSVPPPAASAGYFSVLPREVELHIMSYLSESELNTVALLSNHHKQLADDDELWRRLYGVKWASRRKQRSSYPTDETSWKNYFVERQKVERHWKTGEYAIKTVQGHSGPVLCLSFDNRNIITGSGHREIRVWDLKTRRCKHTLSGHTDSVYCLQHDDEKIVSGSADKTVRIWQIRDRDSWQDLDQSGDEAGIKCTKRLTGHTDAVMSLQYDKDRIVTGSADNTIKVWDPVTGKCLATLQGHTGRVWSLQFEGNRLVSGANDKTIRVWDLQTGVCTMTLQRHTHSIRCLQFDKNKIMSGSNDRTIKLWDVNTGQCLHTLKGHTDWVRCLKFDDSKMASGGFDETIKLWDMHTGKCLTTLKGHTDAVMCLQFDSRRIVSGSKDKNLIVWDFTQREKRREGRIVLKTKKSATHDGAYIWKGRGRGVPLAS